MKLKITLLSSILFLPVFFFIGLSQGISTKRGIAYDVKSIIDLNTISSGISWWYNWDVTVPGPLYNTYESTGVDYVPMAWNGSFNQQALRDFLTTHTNVKYILAFNEPNFTHQANMTPTQAAAAWPKIEAIADEFNLKIVGPAVNYCDQCVTESGTTYTDPFEYLDDFFAKCSTCRVDYIAMHSYMNSVGALSWYVNQFKKYGKPIWVTEFAGWEDNDHIVFPPDQQSFLIGAVDYLESDTSVFRYAWFTGRTTGGQLSYPYIDLLGDNGQMTSLGEIYNTMPLHDSTVYKPIPAMIEAEQYGSMQGILLEKTSDLSGFANCGYIDVGDWLEYPVECSTTGTFPVDFRVAANSGSEMDVLVDGNLRFTQAFTNTGGWQVWQTFHNTLNLEAGKHKIKLVAKTAGYNINWLEFKDIIAGIDDHDQNSFMVYPNPAHDRLYLKNADRVNRIEIIDVTGQVVMQSPAVESLDISYLAEGLYKVRIRTSGSNTFLTASFIKTK